LEEAHFGVLTSALRSPFLNALAASQYASVV
jgi:hypothetical protein